MIGITGIDDRDQTEFVIMIDRNSHRAGDLARAPVLEDPLTLLIKDMKLPQACTMTEYRLH